MRHERTTTWIWLGIGIIGLILLYFLYPSVHPWADLSLPLDDEDIRSRTSALLLDLGLDSVNYSIIAKLRQDGGQQKQDSAKPLSASKAHAQHRYIWNVRVFKSEAGGTASVRLSSSEERTVERLLKGDINVTFDTQGNLEALTLPVPDSLPLPSLDSRNAQDVVRRLMTRHVASAYHGPFAATRDSISAPGDTVVWSVLDAPSHRNWTFLWSVWNEETGDSVDVRVELAGNTPAKFSLTPRKKQLRNAADAGYVDDILQVVFYVVLSILVIVVGMRRLRAYEIGFRTAFAFGIVAALSFGLSLYFQITSEAIWEPELFFPLILAPLLVGGAMVVIWAVGESIGRETWKEKFITVDLLLRGHVLHSRIGHALLRGAGGGAAMAGAGLLAVWLLAPMGGIGFIQKSESSIELLSSGIPALYLFGEALNTSMFEFAFAVLFFVSLLRQKLRITALVLLVAAVVLALPNPLALTPPFPGIAATVLPAFLLVLLFVTTDVIGTLAG